MHTPQKAGTWCFTIILSCLSLKSDADLCDLTFLNDIESYFSCFLSSAGGLVDAGPEYQKALAEEITKLQRLYGGGDLSSFPDFKFPGVYIYLHLKLSVPILLLNKTSVT